MKSEMRAERVTIRLDEPSAASLAYLKGTPLATPSRNGFETFKRFLEPTLNGRNVEIEAEPMAKALAIILQEAIFALEDFKAEHGYIPRQPRFEVALGEDGPAEPRRAGRLADQERVEAFLRDAEEA